MASPRLLSHSEIQMALTCPARHAFAYTGRLTAGTTLRSRSIAVVLSEGRAWGAAVAKWHEKGHTLLGAVEAVEALRASLDEDELQMRVAGLSPDLTQRVQIEEKLISIFSHYTATQKPLRNLTRLEDEIIERIPSRGGVKRSTHYRFQCFIDGWTTDIDENPWLVEFKLRNRLSSTQLIQTDRQLRWYSWALREAKGIEPVGVILDERLNQAPKPARLLKDRHGGHTVSHAIHQLCTAEEYVAACQHFGVEPLQETLRHLNARAWGMRTHIMFRKGELDEAGLELTSAAKLIRDLDSGELAPIRNVSAMNCNGCRFREICPHPEDELYVDTLFERTIPKRKRLPHGTEVHSAA